eukprot:scaffold1143_cov96-Cylindrotheca_fusiformis.AAC.6
MSDTTEKKESKAKAVKAKASTALSKGRNKLTESKFFKKLVHSTFSAMDSSGGGEVSKDELYAGLLMVHLKLAKFAGAAACYPPNKPTCDKLFEAADHDNSGTIDEKEFVSIMGVCCAQILSRMVIYYLILLLFVPFASAKIVDSFLIPNGSYMETILEAGTGFAMFYIAVPVAWDYVDEMSQHKLERKPDAALTGETTGTDGPTTTAGEKKDD